MRFFGLSAPPGAQSSSCFEDLPAETFVGMLQDKTSSHLMEVTSSSANMCSILPTGSISVFRPYFTLVVLRTWKTAATCREEIKKVH